MFVTAAKAIAVGAAAGVALGVYINNHSVGSVVKEVESVELLSTNKASPVETKVNKIVHINNSSNNTITLRGEVNYASSMQVINDIRSKEKEGKELFLLIDSPGGSVVDGAMVLSAIENSKSKVNTVCLRLCASMGFMIHQHGNKRQALNRSILMAHHASGGARGEIPNAINLLATIQRYVDKMDAYIAKRSGHSLQDFEHMISNDMWIDAEDAKEKGFLDQIVSLNELGSESFPSLESEEKKNEFKTIPKTTILDFQMVTK